jgi:hypothetical protein
MRSFAYSIALFQIRIKDRYELRLARNGRGFDDILLSSRGPLAVTGSSSIALFQDSMIHQEPEFILSKAAKL